MTEDELDALLAAGEAKENERREREAQRAKEIERERRLEDAFHDLNVQPDRFHEETGEFPEWDDCLFPPPPPANYWRWYSRRVIRVANVIVEDGWKSDLENLQIAETNGKIALGLLLHALKGDVESLAGKIEKAIMLGDDGQDTKAWLVVRIVRLLTNPPEKRSEEIQPISAQAEAVSGGNAEDAAQEPKLSTEEVQKRLLRKVNQGDEFTSKRQLEKEIGCTYYKVDQAIKSSLRLQEWESTKKRKGRTKGMSGEVRDGLKQSAEMDPAKIAERKEEAEVALRKLIEESSETQKAIHHEHVAAFRDNPELLLTYIEQAKDHRSDRVLDRS